MLDGVTVVESSAQKDEIILEGNDVQNVSQSGTFAFFRERMNQPCLMFSRLRAASIQGSCRVRNKDIRKVCAQDFSVALRILTIHPPLLVVVLGWRTWPTLSWVYGN